MNEILLYDDIREGHARMVLDQLRTARDITVRINSPGGVVAEGLAIFNALKAHPHPVTVMVDGFALSIASLIAMAGQTRRIAANGILMIHDPWVTVSTGNSESLMREAGALNLIAEAMVTGYAETTGMRPEEVRNLMRTETWLSASEAVELGFMHEIASTMKVAARFDLTRALARFHNVPKDLQPMTAQTTPPPEAPADPAALLARMMHGEQDRKNRIRSIFGLAIAGRQPLHIGTPNASAHGTNASQHLAIFQDLERQCLDDPLCAPEDAHRALRAVMFGMGMNNGADAAVPSAYAPVRIEAAHIGGDDFVDAATDALLVRARIRVDNPHPGARDLSRMSVLAMAETIVDRAGVRLRDRSPQSIIRAAHSTTDFPYLLANTAGKALMRGYQNEPASHRAWVRAVDVADFKEQSRIARSEAPALLEIPEGGEFRAGAFGERREAYSLGTYGRMFLATRQMIVNDDLGAFTDLPAAFGASAARLEADKVYGLLSRNPDMSDGVPLFHSSHGNLAGASGALSVITLGAARAAMRKQQGIAGVGYLNLVPSFLIVPASLETEAESLLASISRPDAQVAGVDNPAWIRSLTLVVDARLDASSETAWYLAANSAQVDTVEVAYLQGQRGVFTEEENDFNTDAFRLKARLDFQAAAIDWRGLYKNPGA